MLKCKPVIVSAMQTLQARVCTTKRYLKLDPTCSGVPRELISFPSQCTLPLRCSYLHEWLHAKDAHVSRLVGTRVAGSMHCPCFGFSWTAVVSFVSSHNVCCDNHCRTRRFPETGTACFLEVDHFTLLLHGHYSEQANIWPENMQCACCRG